MERVELIHAPHELAELELPARHRVKPVVAAPEERDHVAGLPAALLQIAVGRGLAGGHVVATAVKLQGHPGRSTAEVRRQALERHVVADEVAFPFANDVLGQDGQLCEIVQASNLLAADAESAKHLAVIRHP